MTYPIRLIFLLLGYISFSLAYANPSYSVHCPESIAVKQSVENAYSGWRSILSQPNYYLSSVSFYSGKPEEMASLKPDISHGKAKWTFSPDDPIYIVCGYNQTSIQLTQPLIAHTTQCIVDYDQNSMSASGLIPMQINCSSMKSDAKSPASKWVSANDHIEGLTSALQYVKTHSQMGALFPARIPQQQATLYASYSSLYDKLDYNQYWEIAIKNDPHCQVRGCVIGNISATRDGKLTFDYLQAPIGPNAKTIPKQKISLVNNTVGYFTPGHAEADWHPPTIEWQMNKILYVLSWEIKEDAQQVLTSMANSAIQSAQH